MRLECTKKLLDYIGVKPEKAVGAVEPLFGWTANLIILNRRKTLVVVHSASRCMFLLHGLTAKMLPKLPELILAGIRILLRSEYVRPEIIEQYLEDCGRDVTFYGNSSRAAVASCNKACERVKMFSDLLEPGDLYQPWILPTLNEDMISKENYAHAHELLLNLLRQRYGENLQSCRAVELEIELLHTGCKRRVFVPENLNFYQLHNVLQGVFEWHDRHLHQFVLEQDRYGRPVRIIALDEEEKLEEVECLNSLNTMVGEIFQKYKKIDYEYDFGDGWCHTVKCRRFIADHPDPYPSCIQAIGDAPMEDSGGPGGFAMIREIMQDPKHPEYRNVSEWVRGSLWRPLDVELLNRRIRNVHRRPVPVYYG